MSAENHTAQCLAASIICAVENMRDYALDAMNWRFDAIDAATAAYWVAEADYVATALQYLADGVTTCKCVPAVIA